MAKRAQSGRREEMKGGTQRRMAMAFRWVRLERPLCSAWTRRVRFPGVRALGGSSARRLGGLTGRQLTGPVAEAPEVDLRRSARSDHETELAARSPGGADANSSFSTTQVSVKKVIPKKLDLDRGCAGSKIELGRVRRSIRHIGAPCSARHSHGVTGALLPGFRFCGSNSGCQTQLFWRFAAKRDSQPPREVRRISRRP